MLEKVHDMRVELETNSNIKVPLIRLKDNAKLNEFQCIIFLKGEQIIDFDLKAIDEKNRADEIILNLKKVITYNLYKII